MMTAAERRRSSLPVQTRLADRGHSRPVRSANESRWIGVLFFRNGCRFARIGYLNHKILERLGGAGVARNCMQRVGPLIKNFAGFQGLDRAIVDLHLVTAVEDIPDRMTTGMAV